MFDTSLSIYSSRVCLIIVVSSFWISWLQKMETALIRVVVWNFSKLTSVEWLYRIHNYHLQQYFEWFHIFVCHLKYAVVCHRTAPSCRHFFGLNISRSILIYALLSLTSTSIKLTESSYVLFNASLFCSLKILNILFFKVMF